MGYSPACNRIHTPYSSANCLAHASTTVCIVLHLVNSALTPLGAVFPLPLPPPFMGWRSTRLRLVVVALGPDQRVTGKFWVRTLRWGAQGDTRTRAIEYMNFGGDGSLREDPLDGLRQVREDPFPAEGNSGNKDNEVAVHAALGLAFLCTEIVEKKRGKRRDCDDESVFLGLQPRWMRCR